MNTFLLYVYAPVYTKMTLVLILILVVYFLILWSNFILAYCRGEKLKDMNFPSSMPLIKQFINPFNTSSLPDTFFRSLVPFWAAYLIIIVWPLVIMGAIIGYPLVKIVRKIRQKNLDKQKVFDTLKG